MNHKACTMSFDRTGTVVLILAVALSGAFIQPACAGPPQTGAQLNKYQHELERVEKDRAAFAEGIVQRWEAAARASGRWDGNWSDDLFDALSKLPLDNLLAADKAQTFEQMMAVLANGPQQIQKDVPLSQTGTLMQGIQVDPNALGQFGTDQVYTPVTPCRIVDTKVAGGPMVANTTRTFDVDGSDFSAQGGFNGSCGIPFGVASAVAMTIIVNPPSASGLFKAWGLGAPPTAVVLKFAAGETLATTTIVPVVPGAGNDFSIFSTATAHLAVNVIGYFAAPNATALDCITVTSSVTPVGVNVWTAVDAFCPAGRTVTGGGHNVPEGTLGRPGVWVDTIPNGNGWRNWVDNQTSGNRNVQTYAVCCRIPGR